MKTSFNTPGTPGFFRWGLKAVSAARVRAWLGQAALALLVALGVGLAPARAQDPGAGGTQAGFEIDAHFQYGIIPPFWAGKSYLPNTSTFGDDWSKGNGTTGSAVLKQSTTTPAVSVPGPTADASALWQIDGNWGTSSTIGEQSVFAGSSNKNGNPIGAGQSPYSVGTGSGGPQKNDITNTFLYARTIVGKLWLFFGAETRSVNGSSYIDFEYNQAGAKIIGNQLVGQGKVNGRTVNDFLLVVNYTGGGNKPVVGVRQWLASGTWSAELPVTTLNAFVTTNTADVAAVAPNRAFTSDGAPTSTTGALQFVEGGLNITDVFKDTPLDQCTPLATITVKTRSSPSYTSELKDYDILRFPLTPTALAVVPAVPAQCKDVSGTTAFSVRGTYANGTPLWSVSGGGTLSNQVYNADGTATATVSILNTTTTTVRVTLTTTSPNSACLPGSDGADLTLNSPPAGTNTTMSTCPTTAGGSTGVFDLTSKNATVVGSSGATVEGWYETYTAATNAFTNPIGTPATYTSGSKTVYAKLSGSCIGVANNVLSLTASPLRPNVTITEPRLCGPSTATVMVPSSILDATYKLLNNGVTTTKTGTGGDLSFGGLAAGSGFSITVTIAGCESAPTDCSNYETPAARAALIDVQPQAAPLQGRIQTEAYPNPTSKDATINFSVPKSGHVVVSVYDALGRPVATLFDGQATGGEQRTVLLKGEHLSSGNYYYRVTAGGNTKTSRISLNK